MKHFLLSKAATSVKMYTKITHNTIHVCFSASDEEDSSAPVVKQEEGEKQNRWTKYSAAKPTSAKGKGSI